MHVLHILVNSLANKVHSLNRSLVNNEDSK